MAVDYKNIHCLAIIAGGGHLPWLMIDHCLAHNINYIILAFDHIEYARDLRDYPHKMIPIGKAGQAEGYFKENHISHLLMAGAVPRPSMSQLMPDATAIKMLMRAGGLKAGDDGVLSAILNYFQTTLDCEIVAIQDFCDDLLVDDATLPMIPAPRDYHDDINKGFDILNALSPFDIGQSLVIQDAVILAIEAAEGTDAMINRTKILQKPSDMGAVLIKTAKHQQSRYADMPVIGPQTIKLLAENGFAGLAMIRRQALVVNADTCLSLCQHHHLFIHYHDG